MKKNKLIIILFIVAAIVLVMYVCSGAKDGSEDAALNGKWKCLTSGNRVYLTFYDDGTGEEEYEDDNLGLTATTEFTWSMVDGRLELSTDDTKHQIKLYGETEKVADETGEDNSLLFNRVEDWTDEVSKNQPPVGEAYFDTVDFSHDGDLIKMYHSMYRLDWKFSFIRVNSSLYYDWQDGKWSLDDEDSYEDEDE